MSVLPQVEIQIMTGDPTANLPFQCDAMGSRVTWGRVSVRVKRHLIPFKQGHERDRRTRVGSFLPKVV